jgi:hypothetical protein
MKVHSTYDGYKVKFTESELEKFRLWATAVGITPLMLVSFIIRSGLIVTDLAGVKAEFR